MYYVCPYPCLDLNRRPDQYEHQSYLARAGVNTRHDLCRTVCADCAVIGTKSGEAIVNCGNGIGVVTKYLVCSIPGTFLLSLRRMDGTELVDTSLEGLGRHLVSHESGCSSVVNPAYKVALKPANTNLVAKKTITA